TGTGPRKCTPNTGPPAATGRTRSAREGSTSGVSMQPRSPAVIAVPPTRKRQQQVRRALGEAAFEALPYLLFRQVAADEDDAAVALLHLLPRALVIAVEDHVHALEDEALGIVLERQNTLAAQNVRPLDRHQILNPREEPVGIERPVGGQRYRLHLLVVIVLQTAAVVMVAVPVMVMIVVVVMAAIVGGEKIRLDVENAVEVEGVAA